MMGGMHSTLLMKLLTNTVRSFLKFDDVEKKLRASSFNAGFAPNFGFKCHE